MELEQALQRADRALGNDGKIGLPYWDFSVYEGVKGDNVMPRVLREHFAKFNTAMVLNEDYGEQLHTFG